MTTTTTTTREFTSWAVHEWLRDLVIRAGAGVDLDVHVEADFLRGYDCEEEATLALTGPEELVSQADVEATFLEWRLTLPDTTADTTGTVTATFVVPYEMEVQAHLHTGRLRTRGRVGDVYMRATTADLDIERARVVDADTAGTVTIGQALAVQGVAAQ